MIDAYINLFPYIFYLLLAGYGLALWVQRRLTARALMNIEGWERVEKLEGHLASLKASTDALEKKTLDMEIENDLLKRRIGLEGA